MARRKSIELELDLQNRDAQRALKQTAEGLRDVAEKTDDVESAGKQMARAIERAADDMIDEIDDTRRAVDALERALGSDFDADTREVVADLKAIGLTAQDIEQDAEELAAALKKSGDVKVHAAQAGFDDLGQAVGSVREETGKTQDTMTGFIGGTVGELPGISEAMGPVGEGLGQLAEGALEGEINFKQLAVAGAAMGGVAFVLSKVQNRMERIAESKALRKEQVEAYEDALRGADSAVQAIVDTLTEAEEIVVDLGEGLFELDLLPSIERAGIGVKEFAQLVEGGEEAISAYRDAAEAAGVEIELINAVVLAATSEHEKFAEATENAARTQAFFGEEVEDTTEAVAAAERAIDAQREALEEATEAAFDAVDSIHDLERAQLDLTDAVNDERRAQEEADRVLADSEATAAEKEDALIALRRAQMATSEAALAQAEAYAREKGAADGTAASASLQVAELQRLQRQYPHLRDDIQVYIDKLLQVPGSVNTVVTANTSDAVGKVSWLSGMLRGLSNTARNVRIPGGQVLANARGTSYSPGGPTLVGEEGPELVNMPMGSSVAPYRKTADMLGKGGPVGGGTTNVTVNLPAGLRSVDVYDALRRWGKVQGPL